MKIKYENLEKHFYLNINNISPYYKNIKRIPRKLKKKVKSNIGVHWYDLSNEQRLWYYMDYSNKNYKNFLIKQLITLIELK